jgi:hypothetical protein
MMAVLPGDRYVISWTHDSLPQATVVPAHPPDEGLSDAGRDSKDVRIEGFVLFCLPLFTIWHTPL